MRFTQGMRFQTDNPEAFLQLLREYDQHAASLDVMGFLGTRVYRDRKHSNQYLVMAEFAEVDGQLTAEEEARRNDARNEAEGWYQRFLLAIGSEPEWTDYDELYHTGITGNIRTG